jgi:hypothetical protein
MRSTRAQPTTNVLLVGTAVGALVMVVLGS